ncbi:elongation factor ts, putative [Perkinsus marinus ATCC 50983]|uniref:Elongation factor Ts, mitochondrial n=1 Tax=Perkinsus marinus (strain ATCC 50983 / TXsc) TaxID=423536 RepID=C5LFD8_PERM5|nr:elongation factor ts, putative [Perkinsus marinus ATCC 50983]EER04570.1 elongation factor ts, putative [Perkinsus marinus ATCC 50983]|eukprot:XP_002772754.1 elongation factor ts, putative [Perkinsus marinus ATCC 50983]
MALLSRSLLGPSYAVGRLVWGCPSLMGRSFCASPQQAYKPSMALVQELRKRTGASISKCRDALADEGGDVEKAMTWLKKRGIQSASEKTFRRAGEGVVAAAVRGHYGALVEISCETDFVGRTPLLIEFAHTLADLVTETPYLGSDVEGLLVEGMLKGPVKVDTTLVMEDHRPRQELQSLKVSDAILEISSILGENIGLKRVATIGHSPDTTPPDSHIFHYVHSAINGNQCRDVGKLASLVMVGKSGQGGGMVDEDTLAFIGKVIAMQVVAKRPKYIQVGDVPKDVLEAERQIGRAAHLAGGGKEIPDQVLENILDGKAAKMRAEDTLYEMEILLPPSSGQSENNKAETVGERLRKLGLVVQDFRFMGVGL